MTWALKVWVEYENKVLNLYIRQHSSSGTPQLVCHSLIFSISHQRGTKWACFMMCFVMDIPCSQILIRDGSTHGGLHLVSLTVLCDICMQYLNGGQGVSGSSGTVLGCGDVWSNSWLCHKVTSHSATVEKTYSPVDENIQKTLKCGFTIYFI